jgi:heme exporter protein A
MSAAPEAPTETRPLLQIENLGKRFDGAWVLRGITFELGRGQGLVLRGRNGSGKSTLLKCLAGLLEPTSGSVRLGLRNPRTGLAMAALDQGVYPHLSVREHFELFGDLRGVPSRAGELAERFALRDALGRHAGKLSTGMRGRLKLALAIQSDPELLLLDEPGAALDEAGRDALAQICREQQTRGALVLATNDPSETRLGTHVLELN